MSDILTEIDNTLGQERTVISGADLNREVKGQNLDNRAAGWDKGEYIGRDGLAVSEGQVAFASHKFPAWHNLGTVVDHAMTAEEALTMGGLNRTYSKKPVYHQNKNGILIPVDDQFTVVDDATDEPLPNTIVGKKYTIVQNVEATEFLTNLVADGEAKFETAGALRNFRQIFLSMDLPEDMILDAEGVHDVVRLYIVGINSHDGSGKFQVVCTPWRPECANTVRFGTRDAVTSWGTSHTRNAKQRWAEARRTLGLTFEYREAYKAEAEEMIHTPLTTGQLAKVIDDLWPVADDAKDFVKARATERREAILGLYETAPSITNVRGTAWGGFQAITDHLDHAPFLRQSKTMSDEIRRGMLMFDSTLDEVRTRAKERLLLVRQ